MNTLHKASLLLLLAVVIRPVKATPPATVIFELSLTGKNVQAQVVQNPGVKPPTGPVNDKVISEILRGVKSDFSDQFVDVNASNDGKYYLLYDGKNDWRVGIHKNGQDAVPLHGQVDNVGGFMMFGTYNFAIQGVTPPMFECCAVGKVTFVPKTFDPKKIIGTLYMTSPITGDVMTLKFRTKGIVVP